MYLMDVNVLVYAHREDVDRHNQYRAWLESVVNSDSSYGYSELVLSGFLRIVTHPNIFGVSSPLDDAFKFVQQIKSQQNAVNILSKERHWNIFEKLHSLQTQQENLYLMDFMLFWLLSLVVIG